MITVECVLLIPGFGGQSLLTMALSQVNLYMINNCARESMLTEMIKLGRGIVFLNVPELRGRER